MQAYDRQFIEEWFSAGNQLCPQTQQDLSNTNLIPNNLVRNIISQWCAENGFNLPSVVNEENQFTSSEQKTFEEIFKKITSSQRSIEMKQAIKDLRLLTKRDSDFRAVLGERPDSIARMIFARNTPGLQNDPQVEDMVTVILNFSLHESNKNIIGDDSEAIPFLVWALKSGDMGSCGNAAAAIFTLSALDSNKEKIGELGAMEPLIDLFDNGNIVAKKEQHQQFSIFACSMRTSQGL
jgi:hypothetical protein